MDGLNKAAAALRRPALLTGPLAALASDVLRHADDVTLAESWPTALLAEVVERRAGWEGWKRLDHMTAMMLSCLVWPRVLTVLPEQLATIRFGR